MNKFNLLLAVLAVALSGCTQLTPVPTTTSTPLPPATTQPTEPAQKVVPVEPRPETIKPTAAAATAASPAAGLLVQGWAQFNGENYQGSLGIAQRAQRIDPRNPEVYLLMARSQFALYQVSAAEQLVRRGLSLSQAGTTVHRQLQALLVQITAVP